jgi:hypothetical protein
MSEQHKQKMVDAVAVACNKTYRLWVKRHPEFEEKGRVHIIAHSVRLSRRDGVQPPEFCPRLCFRVARVCARQ